MPQTPCLSLYHLPSPPTHSQPSAESLPHCDAAPTQKRSASPAYQDNSTVRRTNALPPYTFLTEEHEDTSARVSGGEEGQAAQRGGLYSSGLSKFLLGWGVRVEGMRSSLGKFTERQGGAERVARSAALGFGAAA